MEEKDYKKVVEDFRHHYFSKYGVKLDEEIICLIIRVSELHHDVRNEMRSTREEIKTEIKAIKKLEFKTGWDFFVYGLGMYTVPVLIVSLVIMMLLLIFFRR